MTKPMAPVKHVWFDCDGTLYKSDKYLEAHRENAIYSELARLTQIKVETIAQEYPGRLKEFKSNTNAIKSYSFTESQARDIYNAFDITKTLEKDEGLIKTIDDIKKQDISVSIFTNNKRSTLFAILKKLELHTDWFANLMTAEEVAPKPSIEGYKKIIVRSECNPNEIIYVGDREDAEISPAKKEGLNTALVWDENPSAVVFDQNSRTYHFQKKTVYEVTNIIVELSDLVRQQNMGR